MARWNRIRGLELKTELGRGSEEDSLYELLVKGGEVIDPAQGIHGQRDIGISQGKIAALAPDIATSEARKVINATGKIVTPGLIDIHTHVACVITEMGAVPDRVGVLSGVTTVCDAGSTGYANFPSFKKFIVPQAQTDVFCFLHMVSMGLVFMPELCDWHNIDPEAMLKTIEENRDIIRGVKLRATGAMAQNLGIEVVRAAKKVATKARLPLMVHLGKISSIF
ncbi:Adenine deaminase [subsurface metagenome]